MFKKFGMTREEVFINSKQGFIGDNDFEEAPGQLVFEELIANTSLTADDFYVLDNEETYYSMHPAFLDFSLNYSLKKLQLSTLDAALLTQPHETCNHHDMQHASKEHRKQKYFDQLARAFEFYEKAVQDGRTRSYGITASESMLQDQEALIDALRKGVTAPNDEGKMQKYKLKDGSEP